MSIRYTVEATIPFLAAIALVSNKNRQVHVLSSDKSTVRAAVDGVSVDDPGKYAQVRMFLIADEVLPGALQDSSNQAGEFVQVNIPGTDDYETFRVLHISSN
jgi:hypothetical protein